MENPPQAFAEDSIDLADLIRRLRRGFAVTLGLTFLGIAAGLVVSLIITTQQPAVSSLRVTFSFPGFERGTYPNGTKFQPDDIRAPDIVSDAIQRLGVQSVAQDLSSRVRGAIGISGFVSANIIKERDRLRASGQTPPPYFPDEYEVSLSLPRNYPLDYRQRELLLAEIINAFLEKFRRSHVELPPEFGSAFNSLQNADFVEYELILTKETQSLTAYLEQKILKARQFRSTTTNLSFQDLLRQTELFTQIRLNDVLGLIYINGLSKDRVYALVKMDYYLRTLEDQEQRLKEEEMVVTNLLTKSQERGQNYVLATKAQTIQVPRSDQAIVDQGFIDTLLANDAYNFLVRKALDAGLALRRVQADKAQLVERRQRIESFTKGEVKDQAAAIASTRDALAGLEASYKDLLQKVRITLDDYSRQEFGDAVRISAHAQTPTRVVGIVFGALIGCGIGLALGLALSLLNWQPRRSLN